MAASTLLALAALGALLLAPAAAQSSPADEVAALLAFKSGLTKSDALASWASGASSACDWEGITCNSAGNVAKL